MELHALEGVLHHVGLEVGHGAQRVGQAAGGAVLHHHEAVAVVGVGDGEGIARQRVEESLLGADVGVEGLVIVEMIVGDVGEQSARKRQAGNAALHHAVRTDFHEAVFAPLVDHLGHQCVERHGVGGGVGCGHGLVADVVGHRREEAGLVPEGHGQPVEQGGDGGLAVGAGDAHQPEPARRVPVKRRCGQAQSLVSVGHHQHAGVGGDAVGDALAHHGAAALREHGGDEVVTVRGHALLRHE